MTRTASSPTPKQALALALDATALAEGLLYVDDTRPGFTRKLLLGSFAYFDDRRRIRDRKIIARIQALAIPPAYTDVWICASARGHLQATGRDARGRKQYRYHPHWRVIRDATKYERLVEFGLALPRLRARVANDLKLPGMPREKIIAAVIRLLDTTLVRIGSNEYARDNGSYGLTTLRKKHLKVAAGELRFQFSGKSDIKHDVAIDDPRLKRIILRCADLPGHELFQYLDGDGARHAVGSADINEYLHQASGADFTAKDYRTWGGSVLALAALRRIARHDTTYAHTHVVATVREVAAQLRNTPAVCRKCYIHPNILAAFEAGELAALQPRRAPRGLRADEAALLLLLKR
jgi:DNA topoisomerase-1